MGSDTEKSCRADVRPQRGHLLALVYSFKALPGFVRDVKAYEIALLEGKAITETSELALNDEAFLLVNGIAGAVLEAGKHLARDAKQKAQEKERDRGGRDR